MELFQDAPEEGAKPKANQKASEWREWLPPWTKQRILCSPLGLYS